MLFIFLEKRMAALKLERMIGLSKDVFEVMKNRRSVRKFKREKVSEKDLRLIAESARMTPTSVNQQSRKFTIIQNATLIKRLDKALGSNGYGLYDPDALLLISSPRHNTYSQIETGLAVQNAYLAATALGLGTVWTDQIRNRCDERGIRLILDELEIPSSHICWCVLPIGVPAEPPAEKKRTEQIHYIGS